MYFITNWLPVKNPKNPESTPVLREIQAKYVSWERVQYIFIQWHRVVETDWFVRYRITQAKTGLFVFNEILLFSQTHG